MSNGENPALKYLEADQPVNPALQYLEQEFTTEDQSVNPALKYLGLETAVPESTVQPIVPQEKQEEQPSGFKKFIDQAFIQPASSFMVGYFKGSASITNTLDQYSKWLEEKTGIDRGGLFEDMTKLYEDRAAHWKEQGVPSGEGFITDMSQAIYEGGGQFGVEIPAIIALGQWGLPIYSAIKGGGESAEAHESVLKGMTVGGLQGTAMHLSLGALRYLPRGLGEAGGGAMFGGLTLIEELQKPEGEIDWSQVVAQTFLGIGLTAQGRRIPNKEFFENINIEYQNGKVSFLKWAKRNKIPDKNAEKLFEEIKLNESEVLQDVDLVVKNLAIEDKLLIKEDTPIEPLDIKLEPFKFSDAKVEKRFQDAKGVKKEGLITRFRNGFTSIKNRLTREYEHLARNEENAPITFALRKLGKQKNVVADKTIRKIDDLLKNMSDVEYDLFTRKVILEDLTASSQAGEALPFGYTQEILQRDLVALNRTISKHPKVTEQFNKRTEMWNELKEFYIGSMESIGLNVENRLQRDNYFRHMVLEHADTKVVAGVQKRLKTPAGRSFLTKRKGSDKDINSDYLEAEFQVISQMLYDTEVAKLIKVTDTHYNIYKAIRSQAKEETGDASNWRDFIPEGYVPWQPREGNLFYIADGIPSSLARELFEGTMKEIGISSKDVKKVLAVGGRRKEFVIKEEIAETLNNLSKDVSKPALFQGMQKTLRGWKILQLISPRRYFKYNVRNISGDADAVFVGNPSGFLKVPQATKELWQAFTGDKIVTPELRDWLGGGGMESTLQVQEVGSLNQLKLFADKYKRQHKVTEIPIEVWKKYWKTARVSTDFREAILRYANYLDYRQQMIESPDNTPKNYGASIPEEVTGLSNINDRAFMLSNDLLGAYDRVSVYGQGLRQYLYPFWSFQEANMVRYKRMLQNAVNDNKMAEQVGRKFYSKAASPLTYVNIGKFVMKASGMWALLEAWNTTQFPEEEKSLPPEVRNRPHIIFGTDAEGKILHFTRLGALGDIIEWVGMDAAPKLMRDYLDGRKSLTEIAEDIAKAPVKKFANGVSPFIKTPFEIATRQQFFPDVFEPRTIRDLGLHIARQFTIENEYKAATGLPSRGYDYSLKNVLLYESDPQLSAFNEIWGLKNEFLEKQGKGAIGFWITDKGNALYNLKSAIRYKDPQASAKYYLEYMSYEGTNKGIQQSMERMMPLNGLDPAEILQFISFIGEDGHNKLGKAMRYWNDTVMQQSQDVKFNKAVNLEINRIIKSMD